MNTPPSQLQTKAPKKKEFDARKLGEDAILNLRKEVVELHLEKLSNRQICERTKLSVATIKKILALFGQGGHPALALKTRGRKFGHRRLLAPEQEMRLLHVISKHLPRERALDFEFWEKAAIIELIQKEFHFQMCDRTAQLYISRWGFTRPPLIGSTILDDLTNLSALNFEFTKFTRPPKFQVRDWSLNTSELVSKKLFSGVEEEYASLLETNTLLMLIDHRRSTKWFFMHQGNPKESLAVAKTKVDSGFKTKI